MMKSERPVGARRVGEVFQTKPLRVVEMLDAQRPCVSRKTTVDTLFPRGKGTRFEEAGREGSGRSGSLD